MAGAVALGTLAALPLSGTASAEPTFTPASTDVVGVGSDTSQFALDYLIDGASTGGGTVPGYNQGRTTQRLVSFDAKAADGAPALSATIVPKAGAPSITRPNGSGAGKSLLYAPNNDTHIDFARSSSALSPDEVGANLQAVPFAVDGLKLAVRSAGTNAPAAVTPAVMVKIYDGTYARWNQIPGSPAGTSTALIHPLIPQPDSGTRKFFEAQLTSANGGTAVVYGSGVHETQEHSDLNIKNDPNAIAPFSTGRAKSTPTVKTIGGFSAQRALYNVVRNAGLSASWFAPIFSDSGFICSPAAKPLIEKAGFEQLATPGDGSGVCGLPTQAATSNFATSTHVVQNTATALATRVTNRTVRLTATVRGTTNSAPGTGTVQFFERTAPVGAPQSLSGGTAILSLTNVALGTHTYHAKYTSDSSDFFGSQSVNRNAAVLAASRTTATIPARFRKTVAPRAVITVVTGGHAAAGVVTVKRGRTQIARRNLTRGRVALNLPRFPQGRFNVTFSYLGNATTAASRVVKTVTVTR